MPKFEQSSALKEGTKRLSLYVHSPMLSISYRESVHSLAPGAGLRHSAVGSIFTMLHNGAPELSYLTKLKLHIQATSYFLLLLTWQWPVHILILWIQLFQTPHVIKSFRTPGDYLSSNKCKHLIKILHKFYYS